MKPTFLFLVLIILTLACQRDGTVVPSDLLYQRWQLTGVQIAQQAQRSIPPSNKILISFSPDGRIQYNQNGYDGACCLPRRYERRQQTLLVDYSTDQPEYCKYADIGCSNEYQGGSSQWQVEQLNRETLLLRVGHKLLLHQPAD